MCCENIARRILICMNFLMLLFGLASLGIGIWVRVDDQFYSLWSQTGLKKLIDSQKINNLSSLMIIIGIGLIIKSLVGYLGIYYRKNILLKLYLFILITVMCLQVLTLFFLISFKTNIELKVTREYELLLNQTFNGNKLSSDLLKTTETLFKCCGAYGPNDYIKANNNIPQSCLSNDKEVLYDRGCISQLKDLLNEKLPYFSGFIVFLLFKNLAEIMYTIYICAKMNEDKSYDMLD